MEVERVGGGGGVQRHEYCTTGLQRVSHAVVYSSTHRCLLTIATKKKKDETKEKKEEEEAGEDMTKTKE